VSIQHSINSGNKKIKFSILIRTIRKKSSDLEGQNQNPIKHKKENIEK
jgi:hypothetical protein